MIDPKDFLADHPPQDFDGEDDQKKNVNTPHEEQHNKSETDTKSRDAIDATGGKNQDSTDNIDITQCMNSAVRSLDAASASVEGLRLRLLRKEYEPEIIDSVITILLRMQLLDDEAYSYAVLAKDLHKRMGRYGVYRDLIRLRVDSALAQHVVNEAQQEGKFDESAQALVDKIDYDTQGMPKEKRLRKLITTSQRKGHDSSLIRSLAESFF